MSYRSRRRYSWYTAAGPVTVTRADGSTVERPPYSGSELARLVGGPPVARRPAAGGAGDVDPPRPVRRRTIEAAPAAPAGGFVPRHLRDARHVDGRLRTSTGRGRDLLAFASVRAAPVDTRRARRYTPAPPSPRCGCCRGRTQLFREPDGEAVCGSCRAGRCGRQHLPARSYGMPA